MLLHLHGDVNGEFWIVFVRDMQGVVNNSVYQNYLEHTRHEYIKSIGLDFATLTEKGINLMVKRVEIDYQYTFTLYACTLTEVCNDSSVTRQVILRSEVTGYLNGP